MTSLTYADGQGNTQKAISDIQGMVAKGVNALVVFPDAGKAILPALRSAYKAGVVTVPYRVTPGGKAGVDYNVFVDTPFAQAGENWGRWILQVLPKGGNVLMLSGPKGNSQGIDENKGLHKILDPVGQVQVHRRAAVRGDELGSGAVAEGSLGGHRQVPEDRRHRVGLRPVARRRSAASSRRAAAPSRRWRPPTATCSGASGRRTSAANPTFKLYTVSTQNDHARLAIDWAVALATGGKKPASTHFPSLVFENSTTGKPNPVECKANLPGDIYLSAKLSAAAQAKLVKK